jgi:pimeloyl-ACP methyl ester carboxylesterase
MRSLQRSWKRAISSASVIALCGACCGRGIGSRYALWENRRRLVVIVHQLLWSFPHVYAELIGDLARDHRVVTYDARGCGASTRRGPYDTETDAGDLLALAETAGGAAVAMAVGYGYNIAARVASARPDAISDLLCVQPAAAAILPRSELRQAEVMGGSDSVVELLTKMMRTDQRAAVRTLLTAANPELGEDELRERVAHVGSYVSPESTLERTEAWVADDASEYSRALGGRLRILHPETEPIYEGALVGRVSELYPDAHVEEVPGGPISRPDLIAAWVRRVSGVAA